MENYIHNDGKMLGIFFGKVLKHLPHGRCKIYIPMAYSEEFKKKPDQLPSARQATPIFAGNHDGNGVFSYPNIGSTVLCMFLNGDVNYPIYFATLQGGENAFGQYEIIKHDLQEENDEWIEDEDKEEVSKKHLITSGKTHIKWFENGKISAIVEDPIRTICSVDYDTWELGNNNILDEFKYTTSLSNDNVWKIRDHELSNIDCQFVLDNNGDAYGKLSASTHWYNYLDGDNDEGTIGTTSTDNWLVMHNEGEVKFGTLSTRHLDQRDEEELQDVDSHITVNNTYSLSVPGIMNHKVKKIGSIKIKYLSAISSDLEDEELDEEYQDEEPYDEESSDEEYSDDYSDEEDYDEYYDEEEEDEEPLVTYVETGDTEDTKISAWTKTHHDTSANVTVSSYLKLKKNEVRASEDINVYLTSELSNSFGMQNPGMLHLSTYCYQEVLSTHEDESKILTSVVSAKIKTGTDGNSLFQTISSLTTLVDTYDLSNQLKMQSDGEIDLRTRRYFFLDEGSTILKSESKSVLDVSGKHSSEAFWHKTTEDDDNSVKIRNSTCYEATNKNDAYLYEKVKSKKEINGSDVIDFNMLRTVDAQKSDVDLMIVDDITKNEILFSNDCQVGETVLQIRNKDSGNKCVLTLDSQGRMTIHTTDSLSVSTTNSITMQSDKITLSGNSILLDGPTTINNTLHVVDVATIDPDAKIAGISFIGHKHVGNMGAATSPPF